MASILEIEKSALDEAVAHAKETYPDECCGVMLGKWGEVRRVTKVVGVANKNTGRAHDRYELDPDDLRRIDKEGRQEGLDVIGIYHSHPDHPDRPSQFDRDRGQPDMSYVIVAVQGGTEISVKSWIFEAVDDPFEEEELKVI